ncbi:hypothetical protein [Aerosakkonema funiforme]|uniref:hypothetical protein n=1 Tax=Aerosakkonema funiforme TaxID=1246630 RepID=UPI0035B90B34
MDEDFGTDNSGNLLPDGISEDVRAHGPNHAQDYVGSLPLTFIEPTNLASILNEPKIDLLPEQHEHPLQENNQHELAQSVEYQPLAYLKEGSTKPELHQFHSDPHKFDSEEKGNSSTNPELCQLHYEDREEYLSTKPGLCQLDSDTITRSEEHDSGYPEQTDDTNYLGQDSADSGYTYGSHFAQSSYSWENQVNNFYGNNSSLSDLYTNWSYDRSETDDQIQPENQPDEELNHQSEYILGDSTNQPNYLVHQNFDPEHPEGFVIGDPKHEMPYWEHQSYSHDCGIKVQQFVLESLTGKHFSENSLCLEAMIDGYYVPGVGTPIEYIDHLLEAKGIPVEHHFNGNFKELTDKLNHHEYVIVSVDSNVLAAPDQGSLLGNLVQDYRGIPGQKANHAVEVIGVNFTSDPFHPKVILNDPGVINGKGIAIPLDQFEKAWAASDHFMASTKLHHVNDFIVSTDSQDYQKRT